jgi:hypothetical protein
MTNCSGSHREQKVSLSLGEVQVGDKAEAHFDLGFMSENVGVNHARGSAGAGRPRNGVEGA